MTRIVPYRLLRESRGRMFRSVDYTFTYYQGCGAEEGQLACPYCWTRWQFDRPISRFPKLMWTDPSAELPDDIREAVIFVNSAHDTFAPVIPREYVDDLLSFISHQHPSVEFLLQSKWPGRALEWEEALEKSKDRVILGTTLESTYQGVLDDIGCRPPPLVERVRAMSELHDRGYRTRLSLEPLFRFNPIAMACYIEAIGPELIEIGLDNYGRRHRLNIPQPDPAHVRELLKSIKKMGIDVNLKKGMDAFLRRGL